MKNNLVLILVSALAVAFASCIRDEEQNTEADITSFTVDGIETIGNPQINNDEITIFVNAWDDVTHLAPTFTVTEGATVEPASGTVRDFTTPQTYTVTSQDGAWKKTYKVVFSSNDIATIYNFEQIKWSEDNKYHIFYDAAADGSELVWGSGNAGAKLVLSGKPAESYPTSQAEDGFIGKCAKLQTISTGFWGRLLGMPIAAGNLFIGNFDERNYIDALHATQFGRPFRHVPEQLEGYYKYKAGTKLVDGKKDDFSIYAVLFDTSGGEEYLYGDNSLTSSAIVMKAELEDRKETDEWTKFSIPFKYVGDKTIDQSKLQAGKYKLTIVMSSSKDGANFKGSEGSMLYVDELHLYSE